MADNKSKLKQDRKRVSAGEGYELNYFSRKHGLSKEQAKQIIKEAGGSRDKANTLAEKIKTK